MSLLKPSTVAFAFVLGTAAWAGCSAATEDETASDEGAIKSTDCRIFNNQTGKEITAAELKLLNDPVAKKLLEGKCVNTYSEALAKMKDTDSKACEGNGGNDPATGLGNYMISETAAFATEATASQGGFRTVISKTCDKRGTDGLLFSASANINGTSETSVEMIGKDATTGVYNYYEVLDGGQWVFYGNSFDFIGNGYTCKDSGFCVSNNSKKASSPSGKSCASCHVSGGLVMKELDSPWLHWTAGFANGSAKVGEKHKAKLGNQLAGENLELQVVRPSFDAYNDKRASFLASKGAAELLRPLFCTMDINLDSQSFGTTLMVDNEIGAGAFISADSAVYKTLKEEVGQRINGQPAKITDTASEFTYPSRGQIDTSYSRQLQAAGLVDAEFASDILNIDFTRPIFSGQRCGLINSITGKSAAVDAKLLAFSKETTKAKRTALASAIAKDLPALFKDVLTANKSRKPAEEKFLTNLSDAKANAEAHTKEATDFLTACNKRVSEGTAASKKAAMKDIMTFASHVRNVMRKDVVGFNGQDLLEGGGRDNKMVTDSIPDNANALDPVACKLVLPPSDVKAKP